jgi:hypothetical protein
MAKTGPKPGSPKAPGSGRKKGTPNHNSLSVKQRCAELGCDVVSYLVSVVNNQVPCRVCRGVGKTKFQPKNLIEATPDEIDALVKGKERTCQSCWGSKVERISPELAMQAASKLLDKSEPQLKAMEISGSADKPPVNVRVVLVKSTGQQL